MSLPLIAGCLWVLIAACVAMLPMRLQYPPGIMLLIAVPFGLGWIAHDHGWGYALAGFLAFASMFRNPLIYFWRRARGQKKNRGPAMSFSLILACLWLILANVIAMFPSKKKHWPAAYALMTVGLPLLVYVTWENGIWVGLVVFAAAISILRWPARYFIAWVKSLIAGKPGEA